MSENYTYAKFWRCALQVNPFTYSSNYRGKGQDHGLEESEFNQALLEECLKQEIKVIGLADHASVQSITPLRDLLTPHGIVVFPGFEVASNDKSHFVCLFSEDTTEDQLNRYLGRLQLVDPKDGIRPSELSSEELITAVDTLGGFIYAAHCTQDNGILKNRLDHVWKLPQLRAAQIPGAIEDLSNIEQDFYKKVVLNKQEAYRRDRKMAIINAKDIAKPDDLEQLGATCLIKMTRPNFKAFKIAFCDPESRVRLNSQKSLKTIGRIVNLSITGGYLDGVKIEFSDHLNTVIGGRGTGKSTLLECIRFALNLEPKGRQAIKSFKEIIKENLGQEKGRVEIQVISSAQNGKKYTISRRYGELPIVRDSEGNVSSFLPKDLLPGIDIYGQNEIYDLAQDENNQIKLLDRFLSQDIEYENKHKRILKSLESNKIFLNSSIIECDDLKAVLSKLPKLREKLETFIETGIHEKLAKAQLLIKEKTIVNELEEKYQNLSTSICNFIGGLSEPILIDDATLEALPDKNELQKMKKTLEKLHEELSLNVSEIQNKLDSSNANFILQKEIWKKELEKHQSDLEKTIQALPTTAGKSGKEVGKMYEDLVSEIGRIEIIKKSESQIKSTNTELETSRRKLVADLSDLRAERLATIQRAVKHLNKQLKGKLKIEIKPEGNRTPLINYLLDCNLEGVAEKRLAWISAAESITPLSLVAKIREGVEALQEEWGMTDLVANALMKLQTSQLLDIEVLELEHEITISLNVSHDSKNPIYRPLNRLSTGQQCTAILHLLLIENADPLLMDQPEDNLDNAFIADRIVSQLREAKLSRQFLFATHNANIPVFGDAEWIGVCTADESRANLNFDSQGSIDVPKIRDQVANLLEGGRFAFIQRKEKYEF